MTNARQNFAALHVKGDPLILFNIWDAGSAGVVARAGAKALATGSWSVAAANGYDDGQAVPLDSVLANLRRILAVTDLPVTLDFEGGYAQEPESLAQNVARVAELGAVGINFEDQIVGGSGLYAVEEQSARIAAIRVQTGADFFINARTDLFLQAPPEAHDDTLVDQAIARAQAYADAGASGFFIPGLADDRLIARIVDAVALPVNIMAMPGVHDRARMAEIGVARISHGPGPYSIAMTALAEAAAANL